MSEQAIQYRRFIEANDQGYTGQMNSAADEEYMNNLKAGSRQSLLQQQEALGIRPQGAHPCLASRPAFSAHISTPLSPSPWPIRPRDVMM
jgi:hypothetical protein